MRTCRQTWTWTWTTTMRPGWYSAARAWTWTRESTASYTVKLATLPKGTVTVSVTSSDTDEATVNKSSLSFTTSNWDAAQTVTISGVQDDDAWDETRAKVRHSASGGLGLCERVEAPTWTWTSTSTTTMTAGLVFSRVEPVDVDEGGRAPRRRYTVKLATLPKGTVTVSVTSSDTDEATVNKSSLSFTTSNWDTAQTVTISGVQDDDAWDESLHITHEASGASDYSGISEDLDVDVDDDDEAGLVFSRSSVDVDEGSTATYTVKLATLPKGTVTVSVTSSDTDEATVNKSSLSFTTSNWDAAQTVTISGVQDDDAWDETSAQVRHERVGRFGLRRSRTWTWTWTTTMRPGWYSAARAWTWTRDPRRATR